MSNTPLNLKTQTLKQAGLLGFLLVTTVNAQASNVEERLRQECEAKLKPSVVKVVTQPSSIVYDFSKSVGELTARKSPGHRANLTLGLAEAKSQVSAQWGYSMLKFPNGQGCLRPSVTVAMTVSPQTVFVAKEFAQGTCAFNEIVAHELRHVTVNQKHMETVADRFQAQLSQFFGQRIFYGNVDALSEQFKNAMKQDWTPAILKELEKAEVYHQQIDSPEEYARNSVMCNGEVPKRLGLRQPS